MYSFTEFLGLWYLFSAALAFIAGMITNYSLNKVYTFENKSKAYAKQFGIFAFVAVIGLGLNLIVMYTLVENFSLWYMLARLISAFVVFTWSYFGHKHLTFGRIK